MWWSNHSGYLPDGAKCYSRGQASWDEGGIRGSRHRNGQRRWKASHRKAFCKISQPQVGGFLKDCSSLLTSLQGKRLPRNIMVCEMFIWISILSIVSTLYQVYWRRVQCGWRQKWVYQCSDLDNRPSWWNYEFRPHVRTLVAPCHSHTLPESTNPVLK